MLRCTLVSVLMLLLTLMGATQGFAQQSVNIGTIPVYNVTDFGAVGDSVKLNTEAIQRAIDQAEADGGGTVYFPSGDFLCGSIFLKSNITLYLANGCTIWGSNKIDDFIPVGEEHPQFDARHERHFLYAENAENIAIRGQGVIDGNGMSFYPEGWRDMSETVMREAMLNPEGYSSRPGHYIVLRNCRNVVLEDFTLRYSPTWMLSVSNCQNVRIRGISIIAGIYENDGPNTDGIAMSGRNIRVSGCEIITGDDCMVIAGSNISITNCALTTSESALVLTAGNPNGNITISNCTIYDAGSCMTFRIHRGRTLDGVSVNNLTYKLDRQVGGNLVFARIHPIEHRSAVQSFMDKWGIKVEKRTGPPGILRNVTISNVIAESDGSIFIDGLEDGWVENFTFDNIRYTMRGARENTQSANPPHPFNIFGHSRATYGIFARYVKGLTFRNVTFDWYTPEKAEWGSPLRAEHVKDLDIDGFVGRQSKGSDLPVIGLKNVQGAFIRNSQATQGAGTFLRVGDGSRDITVMGNDLSKAQKAVDGANAGEVHLGGNRMR
jgi:hypothetical protein